MVANRIDSTVAAVVLQHHHYFNGGGFPSRSDWDGESHGVAGEEIHVFARIVTVADQFDELRNRPDGSIWPSVRALRWLLEKSRWMRLDPHIAQALLRITPVYSPGSLVRLSTGEEGFVLDWKPGNPCRPSVAIVENLNVLTDVGSPGPTAETFGEATGQSVPDATELRFAHWSDSIRFKVVDLARSTEIHVAETEGVKVAEDNFILPREIRPRTRDGQPYGDLQAA
jgi:hypothetical protein